MDDIAKTAFEKFETLLRTFIPGCIFITALLLAGKGSEIAGFLGNSDAKWAMAAMLMGVVLYGFHYGVLEDFFTKWTIRRARNKEPALIPKERSSDSDVEILAWMSQERWARPVATDVRAKSHQRHLAKQYDWLIFLYCTAYALAASAAVVWCSKTSVRTGLTLLVLAAVFLFAAMRADLSVTRKELWLNTRFPQHIE